MPGISIQTTHRIIPMVYAYSTPEIARHDGHLKIGYTDRQTVEDRVHQHGAHGGRHPEDRVERQRHF